MREQNGKPGLHEMMVRRERLGNAILLHSDKTGAVGQAPLFVKTLAVKRPAILHQVFTERHDLNHAQAQTVNKPDRV